MELLHFARIPAENTARRMLLSVCCFLRASDWRIAAENAHEVATAVESFARSLQSGALRRMRRLMRICYLFVLYLLSAFLSFSLRLTRLFLMRRQSGEAVMRSSRLLQLQRRATRLLSTAPVRSQAVVQVCFLVLSVSAAIGGCWGSALTVTDVSLRITACGLGQRACSFRSARASVGVPRQPQGVPHHPCCWSAHSFHSRR